jgi:mycothiol synthase
MSDTPERGRAPAKVREIQALGRIEALSLSRIRSELYPHDRATAAQLVNDVEELTSGGGRAWIMRCESKVTGYASLAPTPGLPGLYELDGFVALDYQRQGLASLLFRTMAKQLTNSAVKQVFHAVASTNSVAAQFLTKNGFYIEHEEQYLLLELFESLPAVHLEETFLLQTYGQCKAISLFRRLYEAAFAGQAWYQPYESDREVARDLSDADNLLFLTDQGRPVGFLWLRWPDQRLVEIEPVGLLPSYRGRGLGQELMLSGLAYATQQGAEQARVGVWRQNRSALSLYQRLGFRVTGKSLFLAYDV